MSMRLMKKMTLKIDQKCLQSLRQIKSNKWQFYVSWLKNFSSENFRSYSWESQLEINNWAKAIESFHLQLMLMQTLSKRPESKLTCELLLIEINFTKLIMFESITDSLRETLFTCYVGFLRRKICFNAQAVEKRLNALKLSANFTLQFKIYCRWRESFPLFSIYPLISRNFHSGEKNICM